jgi:hypothetical protein
VIAACAAGQTNEGAAEQGAPEPDHVFRVSNRARTLDRSGRADQAA